MMRLPIFPTMLVTAAVATMIALGIWQLQRAEWKEGLLDRYAAAATLPSMAWPASAARGEEYYFRKAEGFCLQVTRWRPTAGQNRDGDSGWSFIASCRTGGTEGPGMEVDMGWSRDNRPPQWKGGEVKGVIAPDSRHRIKMISATPAPGLQPSAPPSPETIPNNHVFYAFQWFFFAAAAGVIYVLALRRRPRR
ncbi:MAG: SURF1 family protein [Sphingosinicella sp.]|nr:SURF1 family protein [Sphingosinicella sp.]